MFISYKRNTKHKILLSITSDQEDRDYLFAFDLIADGKRQSQTSNSQSSALFMLTRSKEKKASF